MAQVASAKWGDLGLRLSSALVLIPAVLLVVWAGGYWFMAFAALLGVLMAYEWTALTHPGDGTQFALHATAALAGAVLPLSPALIVIALVWLLAAVLARGASSKWAWAGVPYVGLPAVAVVLLRADPLHGMWAIVWVMVTVWSADTLAYFAGRIIGGPKLAPRISPKKTWAGLGGAVAGSVVASTLLCWFAGYPAAAALAAIAGAMAIVEQCGDLFKSAWKRHFGVKDSGALIPGHGGVIDRVDGLVAVAVAAAIVGYWRSGGAATGAGLMLW